jgi:DNA polymerase-3 subunit delta
MHFMRFSSPTSFDKHLRGAFPDHIAAIFMIAVPCHYERKKYLDKLKDLFLKKDRHLRLVRFGDSDISLQQLGEEILTPSLFGGLTLIIVEEADAVKNLSQLPLVPPGTHLLLGSSHFKPLSEFYHRGKKEIVVLDLSEEKPWDKERRLQEWLIAEAAYQRKSISSDVVHELLQRLGPDIATLDQELAKLICYIGEKPLIEIKDVEAICGQRDLFTGWQLSEKIVWDRPLSLGSKLSDLGFLFPFFGQLRYQLQLGLRLAEHLEKGTTDLKRYFPNLRPAQFDKFLPLAKARKTLFFHKGLKLLYDLEFAAKSSSLDIALLCDRFQAKLYEKAVPPS